MLLRIWKVSLAPGKVKELEAFAHSYSLPVLKAQPGCLAAFYSRTESECATISLWSSAQALETMESSAQYQRLVRQIQETGILGDNHVTEVFSIYGAFAAEGLLSQLATVGNGRS